MEIIIARLVSNTLVVGKKTETHIKDAVSLNPKIHQERHAIELKFIPFMFPISMELIDIPIDKSIAHIPAPDDLKTKYLEMSSGIEVTQTIH